MSGDKINIICNETATFSAFLVKQLQSHLKSFSVVHFASKRGNTNVQYFIMKHLAFLTCT